MKILLSNDDGICAKGLLTLYEKLSERHTVYVVAPASERSANSHMLSIRTPIKIELQEGMYSVSGTPADCVKFALQHLFLDVDLVIGGINRGSNVGSDIMYSGTCAVAREAVYLGRKAISLSLDHGETFDYTFSSDFIARNIEKIYPLLDNNTFLNINFPNGKKAKGSRFCRIGDLRYTELFTLIKDDEYVIAGKMLEQVGEDETDVLLLKKGYVTFTPIYPYKEDENKIKEMDRVRFT